MVVAFEEEDQALGCVGPKNLHRYPHVHRQQQLPLRIEDILGVKLNLSRVMKRSL
jgi:hypothetical protein